MKVRTIAMGYIFFGERILLVKHEKTGRFMSCGGRVEEGELITEALLREIKEETNLDAEIIYRKRFDKIPHEIPIPFVCSYKEGPEGETRVQIFEYLCQVKNISKMSLNRRELSEAKWFSREEVENSDLRPILKEIILKAFSTLKNKSN